MASKVPVPETRKKTQAAAAEFLFDASAADAETQAKKKKFHAQVIKRAVRYARARKSEELALKGMKAQAKAGGDKSFFVEPEARVAFVVRIRGINDVPPKPRKILQLLRLRQIFNGVFVQLNKSTLTMLRRVEPYIAYGYPSNKLVRALIYKRGYLNMKNNRIPLTDNQLVAETLAAKTKGGVICAEDVIDQLYTGGEHFSAVAHSLWPFKLSAPNGGLKYKNWHFVEGGDYGNRDTLMNRFIEKLL
eukprot:TRINITY_DN265_c0_g1_i1.p2 TRINITY_DN265_c0_g1~~TRINITY_DN265_c0_g1_i1.p2  ORF type:complete len:247 (+),score=127.50 TRINITY_DN265_c0_g1_i1:64-804(+)